MRLITSIILSCFLLNQAARSAQDPQGPTHNSGDAAGRQAPSPGQPLTQLNFQTDLFTGRFGYSVPMPLAAGRHGITPNLGLHYTSGGDNGWCGVGWDLDLGYIERESRYGVPVYWSGGSPVWYDDTKGFVFSLNGKSSSLVQIADGTYRAEIEGGFMVFKLDSTNNRWQVTDKSGNNYYFGYYATSRASNARWGTVAAKTTFRWALDRVVTVNNDITTTSYTTVSNKLYPSQIKYNGHSSPDKDALFTVDFILADRPDPRISARSGFVVTQTKRLDSIVHKVNGQVVWSMKLNYSQSGSTKRSLLTSVTRYGTDQSTQLPTISFGYQQQQFGFSSATHWNGLCVPGGGTAADYLDVTGDKIDLLDMDGDGLPDRVLAPTTDFTSWLVQLNTGSGFGATNGWPLGWQTYSNGLISTYGQPGWCPPQSGHGRLVDINGDGKADRVLDPIECYYNNGSTNTMATNFSRFAVQLNGSTNLLSMVWWPGVKDQLLGNTNVQTTTDYRAVENQGYMCMMDMNGDGLPDRVMTDVRIVSAPTTNYLVQFNTGSGFTPPCLYGFGVHASILWTGVRSYNVDDPHMIWMRLIDINGDGLPDRVMLVKASNASGPADVSQQTSYVVELNNGYGFEPAMTWTNVDPCTSGGLAGYRDVGDSYEVSLRDVNGDGLPDRVLLPQATPYTSWRVQLNTGAGFDNVITWGAIEYQGTSGENDNQTCGIQTPKSVFLDVNGDGLPDRVMAVYNHTVSDKYFLVQTNKGPFPDLMIAATNGIGGTVSVNYTLSTQYDNHDTTNGTGRQLLPFPQWTVSSLAESDGINPAVTTAYRYEGGMWGFARREFNGFAKVTVADPLGLTNVHYFHQSGGRDYSALGECGDSPTNFAKKGMEYRLDTVGSDGKLYKTVLNKVDETPLNTNRHFAFVSQTVTKDYVPGSPTVYKARADQFAYDATGNLTDDIDFGQVASVVDSGQVINTTGSTPVYHHTVYATIAGTSIVDKPQKVLLTSDSGFSTVLRETLYEYSNAGNPTKISNRICSDPQYAVTIIGYDSYGNQNTQTSPAGVVTTTTYETDYQTFPATQTIGSTLTSSFTYEPRNGKLKTSTDAKGLVTQYTYDVFLRLTEADVSTTANGTANHWLAKYDYTLGISGGYPNNSVRTRIADGADLDNGHETWVYSDGLGRPIQTRIESETSGSYRVSDTVYNKRGAVQFTSLPSKLSGTSRSNPVNNELGTLFTFDPIGRLTSTTVAETASFSAAVFQSASPAAADSGSPVGSALIAYVDGNDPWTIVTTDEETSVTKYLIDGHGLTNKVIEPGNYTTTYTYDSASSLINILDSTGGNNVQFSYNNLGQVVAMADPDMGAWFYVRDSAGRIHQQTNANGEAVIFTYEPKLGRVSTRQAYDFNHNLVSAVTNIFDSNGGDSTFPVDHGELYMTIDKEGWEKHGYDLRGREIATGRYLSKNRRSYTNYFGYDDMDRVTSTTYPNGTNVTTTYDSGANLYTVGDSTTTYYKATSFDGPGHLTGIKYGNNVTTTLGYYSNSQRLHTLVSGSVQNLTYTYDKVSDVTSISDGNGGAASAAISSVQYDSLHRLTSLTRGSQFSFTYDSIGNLTSNGEATNAATYSYTGTRLPHGVKSANGKKYAYDLNGNMLVRDNQRLTYDPENHLTTVQSTAATTTFGYGGDGARLWKQTSSTNGLQVWIGNLYEEKNGRALCHIYAGDRLVCTYDATGQSPEYYFPDNLHSSCVVADSGGNITQQYSYLAYGQDHYTYISPAFPTPMTHRFTGQSKDDETGLYYYGARYYDPELGRFIQPDTIIARVFDPQCLNRYSYCANNPLKYTDPTGHDNFGTAGENAPVALNITLTEQKKWVVPPPILTTPGSFAAAGNPYQTGTGQYMMSVRDGGIDAFGVMGIAMLNGGWEVTKLYAGGMAFKAGGMMLRGFRAAAAAEELTTLSASEINFSQRTVSANVDNYVADMKAGNWDWSKSGPLRVMQRDGEWVSYDNRRLLAAQKAGVESVPVQVVDPAATMPGSKMTWEKAFTRRFNDPRNVSAGGAVPNQGLSTQPTIIRQPTE